MDIRIYLYILFEFIVFTNNTKVKRIIFLIFLKKITVIMKKIQTGKDFIISRHETR